MGRDHPLKPAPTGPGADTRADRARRAFLRACVGSAVAGAFWPARSDSPGASDLCAAPSGIALARAGDGGWHARVNASDGPLVLRAGAAPTGVAGRWPLAYACDTGGIARFNPTIVANRGDRIRVDLVNALPDEPTIVHWHGLVNDTRNDGAGFALAQPGTRYAYDFTVRNRAGLYWYHPHPHGLAAGQAYRGLIGAIEVSDTEDRALRAALDVEPGATEITMLLQDRRGPVYEPSAQDRHRGLLGERPTVNGIADPFLDVATRPYRLRILNASNARTYRLGFRDGDGRSVGFTLLGTDGGLLEGPVACDECFLAGAERIDILLDLRGRRVGETVVLESRGFDPMYQDPGASATDPAPATPAMPGHALPAGNDKPAAGDGAWPEGASRELLAFRVRERTSWRGALPPRLSVLPRLDVEGAEERAFRTSFNKGRWRINDRVFAMGETPIEVRRGAREVWLLRNYHTSMPHAMHVHGVQFQVLERETSPDFLAPLAVHREGRLATDLGWKDTVLVWPGESVRIAIDFALPFEGAQTYVFHCHNLEHEDGGMMLGMRVA